MLEVKIKKLHKDAVIPKYETAGSVGMDLTAVSKEYDEHGNVVFGTGLAIQIPEGYYADLRPRSSISKYDLVLANSVGTIDSDYRGELILKFKPTKPSYDLSEDYDGLEDDKHWRVKMSCSTQLDYNIGDRIAQIVILPYPKVSFVEVEELSETERGTGGFGSTNKVSELVEKVILTATEKFVSEGGSMRDVLKGDIQAKLGKS